MSSRKALKSESVGNRNKNRTYLPIIWVCHFKECSEKGRVTVFNLCSLILLTWGFPVQFLLPFVSKCPLLPLSQKSCIPPLSSLLFPPPFLSVSMIISSALYTLLSINWELSSWAINNHSWSFSKFLVFIPLRWDLENKKWKTVVKLQTNEQYLLITLMIDWRMFCGGNRSSNVFCNWFMAEGVLLTGRLDSDCSV